MVDKVEMV